MKVKLLNKENFFDLYNNIPSFLENRDYLYYLPLCHSTNAVAKNLIENNSIKVPSLIIAQSQKNGKGRKENSWLSYPYKDLAFSIVIHQKLLYLKEMEKIIFFINMVSALSIIKSFEFYDKAFSIKLPNDIYYKDRKISGILIEKTKNYFIIGIGINVNGEYLNKKDIMAISLKDILHREISRKDLLINILTFFSELFFKKYELIYKQWSEKSYFKKGDRVIFSYRKERKEGIFEGYENSSIILKENSKIGRYNILEISNIRKKKDAINS